MTTNANFKYCFVAICQEGELEISSMLLFSSLRQHLKVESELIALVPHPESLWGKPSDNTLSQLAELRVGIQSVINPIGPHYPIGNKLSAFNVETHCEKIVFLDSDMLCMNEFMHDSIFENSICARPASNSLYGNSLVQWENVYNLFGKNLPTERMLSAVSKELMPPYFNAGFIMADAKLNLSDMWIRCAKNIEDNADIEKKFPYLDQIALPVAATLLGTPIHPLPEKYNFPPMNDHQLLQNPVFYHYNNPTVASNYPRVVTAIRATAELHPRLLKAMLKNEQWSSLLRNR
jgi:lipopolysaccharide biosynthesis glycosyltransferase